MHSAHIYGSGQFFIRCVHFYFVYQHTGTKKGLFEAHTPGLQYDIEVYTSSGNSNNNICSSTIATLVTNLPGSD